MCTNPYREKKQNRERGDIQSLFCLSILILATLPSLRAADVSSVTVKEKDVVIPTYVVGEPEPNPMFYFGRASQGAEGRIYPYPLYDTLTGRKVHEEALADYQASVEFPENLRSARSRGDRRDAQVAYWIGVVYSTIGEKEKAMESWTEATSSRFVPGRRRGRAVFDRSVQQYYRGLTLLKLGPNEDAEEIFVNLVESGQESLDEAPRIDFFAKSGERQSQRSRFANAHYLTGLGYLGLDHIENARKELSQALDASSDHLGARNAVARLE